MGHKIITWTVRLLVILIFIDGLIDLGAYVGLSATTRAQRLALDWWSTQSDTEKQAIARLNHDRAQVTILPQPGGAITLRPPGSPLYPIDADGLRHTPPVGDEAGRPRLMVLGASVAFGVKSAPDKTVAAELAR